METCINYIICKSNKEIYVCVYSTLEDNKSNTYYY